MATGSGGPAPPVVEDAVHGAVVALRGFEEAIKKGDRLVDVDVMIDVIDQACVGLAHLRSGAGTVQLNVEALEKKIAEEVVNMKTAINAEAAKVREELTSSLGRFSIAEVAITGVTTQLHQMQERSGKLVRTWEASAEEEDLVGTRRTEASWSTSLCSF